MKRHYWILFAVILCLFLTGCNEPTKYNPDLFKPDPSSCWPCQMYLSAFNAFSLALESSLELICSNTFKVMTIALAFWLMYKVFPWVFTLSPPNFKEDFIAVVKVLFKAMIVAMFLTHPDYFYTEIGDRILQPLGAIFLKISELILVSPNTLGIETSQYARTQNTFLSGLVDLVGSARNKESGTVDWMSALWSDGWLSDVFTQVESFFAQTVMPNGQVVDVPKTDRMFGALPMQIQSVIWMIYSALWSGMGLVFQLFEVNTIMGYVSAIVMGFALCQLMFFLPLTFIDAFLRLGIGIILMPIFMAIFVFPIKMFEGMIKKLVDLIMSAFFDILFNCIYVAFLISVLRVYVTEKIPFIFSTDYQASESGLREAGQHLSMDFLVMLVLIMTVFNLSEKVGDITGQFFGAAGQGTNIRDTAKKLLQATVSTVSAMGRVAVSGGTDWSGFKKAGGQWGNLVKSGMDDMNKAQGDADKNYWVT